MLSLLLRAAKTADRPVLTAAEGRGELMLSMLLQQAAAVQRALPPPLPGSMVAFAFADDRAAFAAALLGTWLKGHGAALPESAARERVVPLLARPEVVAFLHDTGVGRGIFVPPLLADAGGCLPTAVAEDPRRIALQTHTACSDGSTKVVQWTTGELLATVEQLVARLQLGSGSCMVTGLTPSFAPAVLAGLLAPLHGGGRIAAVAPRSADELLAAVRQVPRGTLLVTPSRLRQLAAMPAGSLAPVRRVACAGIASPRAIAALQQSGIDVVEVGADWIEGSWPELEACAERLCGIQGVTDAALLPLPGASTADAPAAEVLVAVAAPVALHDELLRQARAALPPSWRLQLRTFAELPREANGSLLHAELFLGFDLGRDGRPVSRTLQWREVAVASDSRRFATVVPRRYAFFEGHFVPYPVLAGVVQLHQLVLPCVRTVQPGLGPLRRLGNVKFQARIAPGDELEVGIRALASGFEFDFEIWRGETRCTSGRLTFAPAESTS